MAAGKTISIRGAREHNLKGLDVDIPRDQLVVITGLSGSGKSTLAFDTIYAEGQRKYVESLSAYARQFLEQLQKPDVESIEGLPPTIAIEQRSASHNPRSTVATTTEIYDYLRLLFARVGQPRCWHREEGAPPDAVCGRAITSQSATQIVDSVLALPEGTRLMVLAPLVRGKKGHHREVFEAMIRQGFVRARVDGQLLDLRELKGEPTPFKTQTQRYQVHNIEAVVDRIVVRHGEESDEATPGTKRRSDEGAGAPPLSGAAEGPPAPVTHPPSSSPKNIRSRLADSIELSLKLSGGLVIISVADAPGPSAPGNDGRPQPADPIRSAGGDTMALPGAPPGWTDTLFSEKYACPLHPECSLEDLEPRLFSFNSPYGACPACGGLGTIMEFDPELIVPDPELPLGEGAVDAWRHHGKRMNIWYAQLLRRFCRDFGLDPDLPYRKVPAPMQRILMYGTNERDQGKYSAHFEGVIPNLQRRWENTESEWVKAKLHGYLSEAPCESCQGSRLRVEALNVFIGVEEEGQGPRAKGQGEERRREKGEGRREKEDPREVNGARGADVPRPSPFSLLPSSSLGPRPLALGPSSPRFNIAAVTAMTIEQAADFFSRLRLSAEQQQIAAPILKEVTARLGFMLSVGLGYLTLDRTTGSLSGGEGQRIRLATQVGSGLVGCCYVLDEPTIGLHQRDNDQLVATLRHLTDIGNTVIVVEHDEDTIRAADHVIDIGPGPGVHGGEIVAQGTLAEILAAPESLTGRYLTGQMSIETPARRRPLEHAKAVVVKGARENNLKAIDVAFPLGGIVCVTGVSGSGKSTLVNQILLRAARRHLLGSREKPGAHDRVTGLGGIDRIIEVDQSPIGRTPRSNPATYVGIFDHIRTLFSQTKEAKIRGYKPGRFSFNVKGGRCEACQGQGTKKIEMHFLPDVYVVCDQCKGSRYNRETLEVHYRGKSIADVLKMTIEEALAFFENFATTKQLIGALDDVGLGYLELGQSSTTLSGGEAQRVKLATELGKRATGHTIYVLDEPTTGLHFADIDRLMSVLAKLAEHGNTVVVIEHNMDVIKCADWLIDLGPEGGDRGGQVVATGTPEQIAADARSYTGQYLKRHLPSWAAAG